ncbi:hypothetical protein ZOSMA_13G00050 [Zostera marina]|uniref:Malectin-like domain-containing protein n=1 Tax=Zostera marina TaxID=29655 RepID=A0A0K9PY01_ZOSMR|nr:hypothetical protein ZOSMA_13G00050 [Zostera marina]
MFNPLSFLLHIGFILLLTLVGSTESKSEFWSINCGGSENYTDGNGILWRGDGDFLQGGGEVRFSEKEWENSLRVFTSLKIRMNCYKVPVGKGKKILVRMNFNYGNYDGKSSPPEFDIMFDGKYGDKLKTSLEGSIQREVIYVTKGNYTLICVGRIRDDHDPFVSQIEIRTLVNNMYSFKIDSSHVLRLQRRIAFGANKPIRYPDDSYDRIWSNETLSGSTTVKSDITDFTPDMVNTSLEKPPPLLLATGIEANTATSNLTIPLSYIIGEVRIYEIFYFTEMSNLNSRQFRQFNITLNGQNLNIRPRYRNLTQAWGWTSVTNETKYALVPSSNSTLPPIISGMEIYTINDSDFDTTKEEEIKSLSTLQKHFRILGEWNGDPCLPINYTWDWIGCAYYTSPVISILNLSGLGLTGKIPDFSDLKYLGSIDLSNNSFSGEIPNFFANFLYLQVLNLANNDFAGRIPDSLLAKNESLQLNYTGNPKLNINSQINGGGNIIKFRNVNHFLITYIITIVLCFITLG